MKYFSRVRIIELEARFEEVPVSAVHMMEMEPQRIFVEDDGRIKNSRTLTSV